MERKDEAVTQIIASDIPGPLCATLPKVPGERFSALPRAAYVHIPFCLTRCRYCDFAVTVGTGGLMEKYVDFVLREIAFTPSDRQGLTSVYLGGGTPSLLSVQQTGRLLEALEARFGFTEGIEISLEANPGTFDLGKLRGWQSLGIGRVSLGVQAFEPHLLKLCGRSHGVAEIYESVALFKQAHFENFNIDLIFGLPHQGIADWEHSLAEALALEPAHLSLYDLILEEGTPFGRYYQPGAQPLPTEDETVDMYLYTLDRTAAAGFDHYEIANFARPGRQCAHNRVYWKNQPYYGIGNGATGYVGGQRIERPRILHDYFLWVERGMFTTGESISMDEELSDALLLGLRLVEGVDLTYLRERFGEERVRQMLERLRQAPSAHLLIFEERRLRLRVPDGLLLSNEIFTLLT